VPPLVIPSDTCYIEWKSDGSNEDWGWMLSATGDVKAKTGGSEAHWLASLDLYASALVSSICGKLIVGPRWIEGVEDSSCGWLEDSLLGGAHQLGQSIAPDSPQAFEAQFLQQLVTRKKPTPNASQLQALASSFSDPSADPSLASSTAPPPELAEVLIYKMRRRVIEDQGNDQSINDAVYATCASLLWGRNVTADAIRFAKSIDPAPSSELTKAWRLAQKMRQFFTLNDIQTAAATAALPETLAPPSLERGDSLYQGADDKVVSAASAKIIEKAK
jgi:hypothetical protein